MNHILGFLLTATIILLLSVFFIKLGWFLFAVPVFKMAPLTWSQALGLFVLPSISGAVKYRGSK